MATLDWSGCAAVERIPGKVGGAWVFRDTRLPVATVIENLEDLSVEEVMEQFDVTREQISAVLEFVAQSLKVPAPAGMKEARRRRVKFGRKKKLGFFGDCAPKKWPLRGSRAGAVEVKGE